jgi:hypothetical protein
VFAASPPRAEVERACAVLHCDIEMGAGVGVPRFSLGVAVTRLAVWVAVAVRSIELTGASFCDGRPADDARQGKWPSAQPTYLEGSLPG